MDGHRFRPKLFLRPELFAKRLELLRSQGFRVLPFEDAVALLRAGSLGRKEIAITIDDGFHSVAEVAIPLLRRYGFPATIYSTTYYVKRNHPIFRLVVQYCFWRGTGRKLRLDGLLPGARRAVIAGSAPGDQAMWQIIELGEFSESEDARIELAREIARRTGVDYNDLVRSRRFTLMNEEQIAKVAAAGTDIQLHTHRHRLPLNTEPLMQEIRENRAILEPLVGRRLRHLCYPSNVWSPLQWPALQAAGVETGTTSLPGMNSPGTEPMALRRFLDHNGIPQILFEAELSGLGQAWRRLPRPPGWKGITAVPPVEARVKGAAAADPRTEEPTYAP